MVDSRTKSQPYGGLYRNIVASIGHTPIVELTNLAPLPPDVHLWAKLESHNPTGSVKDRVARAMLDVAEESGELSSGQTVIEPTSGNTGISLGMLCLLNGYPLRVVMPENVTAEKTRLLKMYSADVTYSEGAKGSNGAVDYGGGMKRSLQLPRQMLGEILAQASSELPNECCGVIATDNGVVKERFPLRNASASPVRFTVDPQEQLKLAMHLDDVGWEIGVIYHSHPDSAAYPSQTDINLAFWPEALYMIVGPVRGQPEARIYSIIDNRVHELPVEIIEHE